MDKANKIKLVLLFVIIGTFLYLRNVNFVYYYNYLINTEKNFDFSIVPVIFLAILIIFLITKYNNTFLLKVEVEGGLIHAYKKDKTNFIISQPEVEKISTMKVNQNNKFYYVFTCKLMSGGVYRWKIEDKEQRDSLLKILEENNFIKKKNKNL
jgi:hypothetical protein